MQENQPITLEQKKQVGLEFLFGGTETQREVADPF